MSRNKNLVYVGIGRIRDQMILAGVADSIPAQERNAVEAAFQNFLLEASSKMGPSGRDKKNFQLGTIFMLADPYLALNDVIRVTQTSENVPRLSTIDKPNILVKFIRADLRNILRKYDNPAQSPSAVNQVQAKVDNVKGLMGDAISKTAAVGTQLNDLDAKTAAMAANASLFATNSNRLKQKIKARNRKMMVLMIFAVAVLLSYVVLAILGYVGVLDFSFSADDVREALGQTAT